MGVNDVFKPQVNDESPIEENKARSSKGLQKPIELCEAIEGTPIIDDNHNGQIQSMATKFVTRQQDQDEEMGY